MRQKLLKKNKKFNFTLHYINDVLSLNNFKFVDLMLIAPLSPLSLK